MKIVVARYFGAELKSAPWSLTTTSRPGRICYRDWPAGR